MVVRFKDLKLEADKINEKINYKKINVKTSDGKILGDIEIKSNIPVEVIRMAIDDIIFTAFIKGGFNPVLYEVATRIGVIVTFTNIVFTAKEKQKPYVIYDTIETLGLYPQIIEAIDKDEYETFISLLKDSVQYEIKHRSSTQGIVDALIKGIPKMGEAAVKGLQGFDPDQLAVLMSIVNNSTNIDASNNNEQPNITIAESDSNVDNIESNVIPITNDKSIESE